MKIILEFFFSTLRKIPVGGFVNQLIKKFRPYTQKFGSFCFSET